MNKNGPTIPLYPALISALFFVSSCSPISDEAYFSRGTPESLLDASSEVVNFSVAAPEAAHEMAQWVEQDQPSRAELYCTEASAACKASRDALDLYGVSTTYLDSPENMVSLVYERVLARDCENRYIDNPINPYNLNHPTFGCSAAVNMVQMVSDKTQFIRPALLGYSDAKKAALLFEEYQNPQTEASSEGISESLLSEGSTE